MFHGQDTDLVMDRKDTLEFQNNVASGKEEEIQSGKNIMGTSTLKISRNVTVNKHPFCMMGTCIFVVLKFPYFKFSSRFLK